MMTVKASNPGQPTIVDTDNDYITIRWTPPENDGGAPILGYNILRKDPTSGRWIQLNTELLKVFLLFWNTCITSRSVQQWA